MVAPVDGAVPALGAPPAGAGAGTISADPSASDSNIHSSASRSFASLDDIVEKAQRSWSPSYRLQAGDAVVIESHEQLLKLHTHSDHFAMLREVVDSKPPITGEFMDRCVCDNGGMLCSAVRACCVLCGSPARAPHVSVTVAAFRRNCADSV